MVLSPTCGDILNVETMCLAILYRGDATGYEIRKSLSEDEGALFAAAGYGSIYPALKKLHGRGSLSQRNDIQNGRPSRKVYSLTDQGRNELLKTLHKPLQEDSFRSPFLYLMRLLGDLPENVVELHFKARRASLEAEAKMIDELLERSSSHLGHWILVQRRAMTRCRLEALDAWSKSPRPALPQCSTMECRQVAGGR